MSPGPGCSALLGGGYAAQAASWEQKAEPAQETSTKLQRSWKRRIYTEDEAAVLIVEKRQELQEGQAMAVHAQQVLEDKQRFLTTLDAVISHLSRQVESAWRILTPAAG